MVIVAVIAIMLGASAVIETALEWRKTVAQRQREVEAALARQLLPDDMGTRDEFRRALTFGIVLIASGIAALAVDPWFLAVGGGLWLFEVLRMMLRGVRGWFAERRWFRRSRRNRERLSYADNWNELRREIYARDDYRCANCGADDIELHAHHIVPLSRGGTNALSNLTTLCVDCHELLHPHMRN